MGARGGLTVRGGREKRHREEWVGEERALERS